MLLELSYKTFSTFIWRKWSWNRRFPFGARWCS